MTLVPIHWFWIVSMMTIVGAGLALVIVFLVRLGGGPHHPHPPGGPGGPAAPPPGSPLDILARRFALGEITAEEYQKARELLRQ